MRVLFVTTIVISIMALIPQALADPNSLCKPLPVSTLLSVQNLAQSETNQASARETRLFARPQSEFDGTIHFTVTGLPKFEDYPADKQKPDTVASDVDWASHPDARVFRTVLSEGMAEVTKHKPYLIDGRYTMIMHGCGGGCQNYWVVDVSTGKVLGNIQTEYGLTYRLDSRLLISNIHAIQEPDETDLETEISEVVDHRSEIAFYKIDNDSLSLLRVLCAPRH